MKEQRVLVFPPSRRDGQATCKVMQGAGLDCAVRYSAPEIAEELTAGAGVLVLTDTALAAPDIKQVLSVLASQPPWSDLPVILLSQSGPQSAAAKEITDVLTNVTLLDRPTSARTLVSTVQAAIRSRLRQYQTRDQLEALRVAEEALRTADRRKDEFLAMLAHELRNPLAPIRNAGEVLTLMLPGSKQVQSTVAIVKRQIAHLTRLVDDLLDVSRITRGRIGLRQAPVELSSVVAEAMESVEPLMRDKRHRVFAVSEGGPLYVKGDHARLVQCVGNILANAAKYTDPGGEINVEVLRADGTATIAVSDNGVGIAPDLLPQIFGLFVQSDRSLDRSQGGLGIGLSVVQRLVEMHGGEVSASSQGHGRGARFEIRLPLIDAPHARPEEAPAHPALVKRILVVDDNADAANSLTMILNLTGHTAESVYGPKEALERAAAFDPEVILLDIGLPGMDGYEVARRIRASGSDARLVALTGYGQSEDIRRAHDAGFDAHMVKPVDLEHLLRNIGEERH